MAQRWKIAGGTPFRLWESDAKNYTQQLAGLRTVEWVDSAYRVRWVEPTRGNEKAAGLNVRFDPARIEALKGAAEKNSPTLTPPLELVQGYAGFIAYLPLYRKDTFDGFIAGIFSIRDFFSTAVGKEFSRHYLLSIRFDGKEYFRSDTDAPIAENFDGVRKNFRIYDKTWTLEILPTQELLNSRKTLLPFTVLAAGFIIAALLALTLRYIILSRIQSHHLRISEETFRSAMEYAAIGMALVSPEGKWLKVNRALCEMVGYADKELLLIDFQTITHPDDLETDLGHVQELLAGVIQTYQMEKRYFHKNGTTVWVLLSVSLVRNADDTPTYFIAQIQNITDRKAAEDAKEKLMGALAQSNTELERFAYVASHDLQEPVRMINSFGQMLLEDKAEFLDAEAREYLALVTDAGGRMRDMINDLLAYSRVGNETVNFVRFDGAAALNGALENLKTLIEEQKAEIRFDVLPELYGSPSQFIRLLQNIVTNAIKYQPASNVPRIRIAVEDESDRWHISVRDNGLGIEEAFLNDIFEPFKRLHSWESIKGSGLGLCICRKIVENHRGSLTVESTAGQGSVFHIHLPKFTGEVP